MNEVASICICTRNRGEYLDKTLSSIENQKKVNFSDTEVIVIDNGSTDNTSTIVEKYKKASFLMVRYVYEEKIGIVNARNRAIVESNGDWIIFIDDDEIADDNWLYNFLKAVENNYADIAGGTVLLKLPKDRNIAVKGTTAKLLGASYQKKGLKKIFNFTGPGAGNVIIRKKVFDEIGYFINTNSNSGEDTEFFERARKYGFTFTMVEKAIVYHLIPNSRLEMNYLYKLAIKGAENHAQIGYTKRGTIFILFNSSIRAIYLLTTILPKVIWFNIKNDSGGKLSSKLSALWTIRYIQKSFTLVFRIYLDY